MPNLSPRKTTNGLKTPTQPTEIGYVISVKNYFVVLNGLPNVAINEVLINKAKSRCLVTSLKEDEVEALLLDEVKVSPNEVFTRTFQEYSIKAGPFLLGRSINPLGSPIDGRSAFPKSSTVLPIYQVAGGIKTREFIKNQFRTGLTTIDMLIPIAKGQRELIIGGSQSGKTGFLIDTIINQRSLNNIKKYPPNEVICVYGLIGKPIIEIRRLIDILTVNKAIDYTTIVATSASDPASLIFLTPYVATSLAEYFQKQGLDVLLILDDMGNHAKFYREISLLSGKTPSRESYPSDVFSLHANLLERAGNFNKTFGGGSITALPVMETNFDDFVSFIATNLMAMTDGHLMFSSNLYHRGIRPAVDISLSVSRVGRQTQSIVQKILADSIKSVLAQASKLETLARFGSEVSPQTQYILNQSKQIHEILLQNPLTKTHPSVAMIMLGLIFTPFFTNKDISFLKTNKQKLINFLTKNLDLEKIWVEIFAMREENQFFDLLKNLIPQLEKICQQ